VSATKHQIVILTYRRDDFEVILTTRRPEAKKRVRSAASLEAYEKLSDAEKEQLRVEKAAKRKIAARKFYLKNKEKLAKKHAEYRRKNPEKRAGFAARWRARRYGQTSHEDAKEAAERVRNLKSGLIGTCTYCQKELPMKQMTIDHIRPLARGGLHVAANLTLSCRPCNSSKNDKILGEQWGNITQPVGKVKCTRTGSNRRKYKT
jgi:5-methylcytosine-specific restriction endonuclease McrA